MSLELGTGSGPLSGLKVVELASAGPVAHACMILADLGADVIRIDRPGVARVALGTRDILNRGRPSVILDLKQTDGVATVLDLVERADVLVEGMRPGVAERLGFGPEVSMSRNPRLIYGRMTGWGQDGPWSHLAGHEMNYIGLAGALDGLGQDKARPHFPKNILGDFGGGSTYLVIGVLAALLEAQRSGQGQVIDAAIVDGTAHLNATTAAFLDSALQGDGRVSGLLDGGTPHYELYETSDGHHMSVAAMEPEFYAILLEKLNLTVKAPDRSDPANFERLRRMLAGRFRQHTQAEWSETFAGTDACVAPVLPLREAAKHPHLRERGTFVERDDQIQPAPAPRFSRTKSAIGTPPALAGANTREALLAWGICRADELIASEVATQT